MADKQPWLGARTFPTIWIWICVLFNIVGILALIMLIIAEFVIIINDFNNYVSQYGHSYPSRGYVGPPGMGFIAYTNAPTHTGSAIWMILYQLSIVVLATLAIASDLAWRKATYNEWGSRYVTAFFAIGIMEGSHNKGLFYYVVANAFLKAFVVILYMSQSFYGLYGGSHEFSTNSVAVRIPPQTYIGISPTYYTTSTTGTYPNSNSDSNTYSNAWKRASPDPNDPEAAYGTELWAQWCGWILLGSIVPSVIAFMFLVPWAAKKNEDKPADVEKVEVKKTEVTVTAAPAA